MSHHMFEMRNFFVVFSEFTAELQPSQTFQGLIEVVYKEETVLNFAAECSKEFAAVR